jgi:hypothetical protein
MAFKKNRKATLLPVLAAGLGVVLIALAVSLPARTSPTMNHVETPAAAYPPQDSGCQSVLDAGEKLFTTPYHMYATQTDPGIQNGKPMSSESISVGGAIYVMVNGKWSPGAFSLEEMKQRYQQNKKTVHNVSCHFVRDESVNGESTALYNTHEETEHGKNDNQMWVSKGKGLVVKQEMDIDIGGGRPKSHFSARYEYTNVQAPKM